jgi:hypothetical protein
MSEDLEKIVQIACEEFRKLLPEDKATGVEIEEVEEQPKSGHYFVTLGYWARDNKPRPKNIPVSKVVELAVGGSTEDFFNPWRKNLNVSKSILPKERRSPSACMNLLWVNHELQCSALNRAVSRQGNIDRHQFTARAGGRTRGSPPSGENPEDRHPQNSDLANLENCAAVIGSRFIR